MADVIIFGMALFAWLPPSSLGCSHASSGHNALLFTNVVVRRGSVSVRCCQLYSSNAHMSGVHPSFCRLQANLHVLLLDPQLANSTAVGQVTVPLLHQIVQTRFSRLLSEEAATSACGQTLPPERNSICAGFMAADGAQSQPQVELESMQSTAGLLYPTSSTIPGTPRQSMSVEPAAPSRGYLADGVTRWGSFTQEQLAAFG